MSNVITGGYETIMSVTVQRYLEKMPIYRQLASFVDQGNLARGVSVNRPYRSDFTTSAYTANTDVNPSAYSLTEQVLTIDQSQAVSIQVDPVQDVQLLTTPQTLSALFSERMAYQLGQDIDRDFTSEVTNAALTVDNTNFSSSASVGDPIDLNLVLSQNVWGTAYATLQANNIGSRGCFAVIDPFMANQITQSAITSTFNISDTSYVNGYTNKKFQQFDVFMSNNLPAVQAFTLVNATDGNTFTIQGVVWTAKDALGVTAGNVYTNSGTVDTWGTNLAKAINGSTAATFYNEVAADLRSKLNMNAFAASYDTGMNILTINSYGRFFVTFTAGSTTAGTQTVSAMCGQYGCIDMVIQMAPTIQINKAVNNLGSTILGHTLWGTKTFDDGAQRLLYLPIKG